MLVKTFYGVMEFRSLALAVNSFLPKFLRHISNPFLLAVGNRFVYIRVICVRLNIPLSQGTFKFLCPFSFLFENLCIFAVAICPIRL